MGTNYFHRTNICKCCNRYDQQHICKSLVSFEAPFTYNYSYETEEGTFGSSLTSWQAWKAHLLAGGEVWNEYGERLEVLEFVRLVESTEPGIRRWQYDYVRNHPRPGAPPTDKICDGGQWLDADGFSFYGGAFS